MAEFPELGKHCQVAFCNKLDFLPFVCSSCNGTFCVEHHNGLKHGCAVPEPKDNEKKGGAALSKPCSHSGCSGTELMDVICPHCHRQFCLQHRHPKDHSCPQFQATQNCSNLTQTQILNKKYMELSASSAVKGKGHKSDATAAKVRLMRLKMKATGEPGVPQEDRVFFQVVLPTGHTTDRHLDCYFSKHWAVGKMIDWIAKTEKILNNNNNPSAEQLRLFVDGQALMPLSASLSDLLTSGVVVSGALLKLDYVPGQS